MYSILDMIIQKVALNSCAIEISDEKRDKPHEVHKALYVKLSSEDRLNTINIDPTRSVVSQRNVSSEQVFLRSLSNGASQSISFRYGQKGYFADTSMSVACPWAHLCQYGVRNRITEHSFVKHLDAKAKSPCSVR